MQFTGQTSTLTNRSLIPAGVRSFLHIHVKEIKVGRDSNAKYANLELTVMGAQGTKHPYEGRKFFQIISDPTDPNAKEEAKRMGMGAMSRILEASGIVQVGNEASYQAVSGQSFETVMQWIDNKVAAGQISIQKGQGGYDDKNAVGEWLSPNPLSGGYKSWTKLMAGDLGIPAQPPAGAPAAVVAAPAFTPPAAPVGAPAPMAAPAPVAPSAPAAPPVAVPPGARPATTTGPSWLANAQGAR